MSNQKSPAELAADKHKFLSELIDFCKKRGFAPIPMHFREPSMVDSLVIVELTDETIKYLHNRTCCT